jgi:TolA-binding protein
MNSPLKIKGGDKDSFLDRIYYLWRHLYNGFFYMAKQDFKLDGEHQDKFQESILGFFEWFTDSKNKKQQKNLLTVLAVVVLGAVAWGYNASSKNAQNGELQEALGQAMVFQEQGDVQKAKAAFEQLLANPEAAGLYKAKAALLLGDILYYENNLDGAAAKYSVVVANAEKSELLLSGAEHGLAAVKIQKGNFAEAAQSLEAFVKKWAVRTGPLTEGALDDRVSQIPEVLVQLGLVYTELGQKDKAAASLKKVVAFYPESRQAAVAKKIAASI